MNQREPAMATESVLAASEIPEGATLADRAYLEMRTRIVTLRMPPGSLVREEEVVRELGMSRTPIREALLRLARQKLVVPVPRRGTFVSDVNVGDVGVIYELRRELEGMAAAWAAERRADADMEEIDRVLDEMRGIRRASGADARSQLTTDQRAHFLIYRMCANDLAADTLRSYFFLSARIWYLVSGRVTMLEPFELMIGVLGAIKRGDAEEARRLAYLHIQHAESTVRAAL
jgi:DNA-binding GntR family transcriptional regulator